MNIDAVDLFCGVGGLTHGLVKAGICVRAGVDIDPYSKFAYETNNNSLYINKSISEIQGTELAPFLQSDITLLAGCAPCQPFSAMNHGKILKTKDWSLLGEFTRLVSLLTPTCITMENVPKLQKHEIYKRFLDTLKSLGYYISAQVVDCSKYGIPQKRKRLVLLASKLGPINLIPITDIKSTPQTVRSTIGHLSPLKAGECCPKDSMHCCASVSPLNLKRLQHSFPNGSWRDWPEELIAKCHKHLRVQNYRSAYGRMAWDEPSPTITTQCHGISHGRFGHPEQDRALSLREAALLQTFPETYNFFPKNLNLSKSILSKMIGNAVPVQLGKIIGDSIQQHVQEHFHD